MDQYTLLMKSVVYRNICYFTIKKTKQAQIMTQAVSPVSMVYDVCEPSGPANVELSGIMYKRREEARCQNENVESGVFIYKKLIICTQFGKVSWFLFSFLFYK